MKTVFVQPEFDPESARAVADALGGQVVPINGLGENVIADIEDIAMKIETAMRESSPPQNETDKDWKRESAVSEPVISLRDVTFSYGGEPVLENVTFSIADRQAVCVVGPNGGGKTTLVKLILGLLTPERGEIRVFGQPPRRARLRIGYMPQHVDHDPQFPVTAMDIVLMGRLGQRARRAACGFAPRRLPQVERTPGFAARRLASWRNLTGWHWPRRSPRGPRRARTS